MGLFIARTNIVADCNPAVMKDMLPYAEAYPYQESGRTYDALTDAFDWLEYESSTPSEYILVYLPTPDEGIVTILRYEYDRKLV